MATGSYDRTIRMWRNGEAMKSIGFPWSQVNCLSIAPDRRFIAAGGYGALRVYDLSATNPEATQTEVPVPPASNVSTVSFCQPRSPGGWAVVMAAEDGIARMFASPTTRGAPATAVVSFDGVGCPILCGALAPKRNMFITGTAAGAVHVWRLDGATTAPSAAQSLTRHRISTCAVQPNEEHIAVCTTRGEIFYCALHDHVSKDGTTRLQMIVLSRFTGHNKYILSSSFSHDGAVLATASADCTVRLWRVPETAPASRTDAWESASPPLLHQRWVWACAFFRSGHQIATAASDNHAYCWLLGTKGARQQFAGHQKPVTCLALHD
jgi:G protein beta subunit-like protein